MSWIAVLAFFMSMYYSIRYLKTRDNDFDVRSYSVASLGFMFCILATATGSLWAKFSWGSFWNWDPRQTSIFILLFNYGAYFALRSAIDLDEQRAKLSLSVYSIHIAAVTVPFFVFIMPRLVESLQPGSDRKYAGKNKHGQYHVIYFSDFIIRFTFLFFWCLNIKVRIERLNLKTLKEHNRIMGSLYNDFLETNSMYVVMLIVLII
ncbi:MAG: cytochrome c biogenesis protein CcsA [Ignavibacteria bacterium]